MPFQCFWRGVDVQKIGVVGLGTMGSGIVQSCAEAGFSIVALDISDDLVSRAVGRVKQGLDKRVEKGRLDAQFVTSAMANIRGTTEHSDLADCAIVIEAVFEKLDLKRAAIEKISASVGDSTLIATNTSSISVTLLSRSSKRPENFIGMHFFNPVPLMPLVEIVKGYLTSAATVSAAVSIARSMKKETIEVMDYPGFASNRILMPMINEAIFALMEGVSTREGIDGVMKLGMNHPMGPLELADFIGLDVCLDILNVLHSGFGDPKYRPAPLLVNMVNAGKLGRKSGEGFYSY
jgi:3-hydroxybutyryl-CoA dehydrogenase